MRTIRRLYFYAVTFVSMEVVLWGLIGLARSIFGHVVGGGVDELAQALALIFVGAPVFWIHWWAAQRGAKKDANEHAAGVRAFFLYAALLALLIPVAQNGLAALNRLMLDAVDLPASRAIIGARQSLTDNLIAAVMNALLAGYFLSVVRADWRTLQERAALQFVRRVYRYVWTIYALVMSIAGVQQILRYLLGRPVTDFPDNVAFFNGLALTLIGAPLWVWTWKIIQEAISDENERASLLRLGVLYILSLFGVIFVLSAAGVILNALLQLALGELDSLKALLGEIYEPLSIAIPLGAVWAYFGHWLNRDLSAVPDAPRRAGMKRLYAYTLALIGLIASFSGIAVLLSFFIDATVGGGIWSGGLRAQLTGSLATLAVGLPLWLQTWRPMQAEALAADDLGDHARRSIVRRGYLYLILFVSVVGGMTAAVQLASLLFRALLGARPSGFFSNLLHALQMLVLFGGLLAYHWKSLQRDGREASQALEKKQADFSALLIDDGDGTLANQLAAAIKKESQQLHLRVHSPDEPLPAGADAPIHAVILPERLAVAPPETLGAWLRQFEGIKLIVPSGTRGCVWTESAQQAAQAIRQLAEGETVHLTKKSSGWMAVVYILAGLMGVQLLLIFVALLFGGF